MYGQVHHAVFANLFQHVVEEPQARLDVAASVAVKIHLDINIRLFGGAPNFCRALTTVCYLGSLVPTTYLQESASDVFSKFAVGIAVANDIAVFDVVFRVVDVFLNQTCVRFARRGIVLRKVGVYENVVELYTFSLQRIDDKILDWPESILRKSIST